MVVQAEQYSICTSICGGPEFPSVSSYRKTPNDITLSNMHMATYSVFLLSLFHTLEKCYSGNKTITSFPVVVTQAFCTSCCDNYRAPSPTPPPSGYLHQLSCSGKRPSDLLTLPFLQSCHLSHHQILWMSPQNPSQTLAFPLAPLRLHLIPLLKPQL